MNKKQLTIAIIIATYCALYALLGTFPIITFYTPHLTPYFHMSLGIFAVFYILLFTSILFKKIGKFKHKSADWLKLHLIFDLLRIAFFCFFLIMLAVSLAIAQSTSDLNLRLFLFIWYMSFIVGIFPYFHRIKNTLGMEYRKIEGASLNGASAFADLARMKLRSKKAEGLRYLRVSLIMLMDYFNYDRKKLRNLDKTMATVDTITLYGDNIPYKRLVFLSEALCQLPILEEISRELNRFLEFEEIKWTQGFVKIPPRRDRERVDLYLEKFIVPLALVIITLFAAFPDSIRMQIVDTLREAEWFQLLGIFMLLFLTYEIMSFLRRSIDISYNDIKEISESKKSS